MVLLVFLSKSRVFHVTRLSLTLTSDTVRTHYPSLLLQWDVFHPSPLFHHYLRYTDRVAVWKNKADDLSFLGELHITPETVNESFRSVKKSVTRQVALCGQITTTVYCHNQLGSCQSEWPHVYSPSSVYNNSVSKKSRTKRKQ